MLWWGKHHARKQRERVAHLPKGGVVGKCFYKVVIAKLRTKGCTESNRGNTTHKDLETRVWDMFICHRD